MPGIKEFVTPIKPTWCPGCGNFGMWEALKRADDHGDLFAPVLELKQHLPDLP